MFKVAARVAGTYPCSNESADGGVTSFTGALGVNTADFELDDLNVTGYTLCQPPKNESDPVLVAGVTLSCPSSCINILLNHTD